MAKFDEEKSQPEMRMTVTLQREQIAELRRRLSHGRAETQAARGVAAALRRELEAQRTANDALRKLATWGPRRDISEGAQQMKPRDMNTDPRFRSNGAMVDRIATGAGTASVNPPSAAAPGRERGIRFQSGAAPSTHARPAIADALSNAPGVSHPERGSRVGPNGRIED